MFPNTLLNKFFTHGVVPHIPPVYTAKTLVYFCALLVVLRLHASSQVYFKPNKGPVGYVL